MLRTLAPLLLVVATCLAQSTDEVFTVGTTQGIVTDAPATVPRQTTQYQTDPPPYVRDWRNVCGDDFSGTYLDVFFLVDSSSGMTSAGLESAVFYIISAMYPANISQGLGQATRVGIISYSTNAKVVYGLTDIKSKADLMNIDVPYDGLDGTNLEAAIQLASAQFSTANGHRNGIKTVIVILASTYMKGTTTDPTHAAASFRDSGGKIVSIEYVQLHGLPVPEVALLATPGYNLTNIRGDLTTKELQDLLCIANCYCATNYLAMGDKTKIYDVPYGGCYWQVPIPALQPLAERYCKQNGGGTLAVIEDSAKFEFLKTVFPTKTNFWVGLTNQGGQWKWDGNTTNASPAPYWAPGEPKLNSDGACAYFSQVSGFNYYLISDDCMDSLNYVCQENIACSVLKYCDPAVSMTRSLRAYRAYEN